MRKKKNQQHAYCYPKLRTTHIVLPEGAIVSSVWSQDSKKVMDLACSGSSALCLFSVCRQEIISKDYSNAREKLIQAIGYVVKDMRETRTKEDTLFFDLKKAKETGNEDLLRQAVDSFAYREGFTMKSSLYHPPGNKDAAPIPALSINLK